MIQKILPALLLAMFFAPLTGVADEKPEVMGVLYYADWCGSCKILEPELEAARSGADLDTDAILFVTLDLTDATTSYQAGLLANQLDLGELYTVNAGATGYMVLVDAETKEVISRVTKSSDATEITGIIKDAIAQASS